MAANDYSPEKFLTFLEDYVFEDTQTHEKFFFTSPFSSWANTFIKQDIIPFSGNNAIKYLLDTLFDNKNNLSESQRDVLVGSIALQTIMNSLKGHVLLTTDFNSKIFMGSNIAVTIYSKANSKKYIDLRNEKFKKIVMLNNK